MAEYAIVFARSARKELQALDHSAAARIFKRIEALALELRPSGVKKLEGSLDLWRIRIGDWRVVYRVSDRERLVDVIAVRHRRDAYR
ncbi:MAG: type II toxin-antitoxin system mRNA interferase toxin, RelE/StbE family [Sphingomonas hengshuiensis]|nr:MAG: type II toxin-antitoxin system mRNA interferase toxin, RelE/StbE family [Sphingomonas hengshuiensis]